MPNKVLQLGQKCWISLHSFTQNGTHEKQKQLSKNVKKVDLVQNF
jgi:hypothetical protein